MPPSAATQGSFYFDPLLDSSPPSATVPRTFKRHKTLPHPVRSVSGAAAAPSSRTLRASRPSDTARPSNPATNNIIRPRAASATAPSAGSTSSSASSSTSASRSSLQPSALVSARPDSAKRLRPSAKTASKTPGPDLPPTPPAQSRGSSSSQSVLPSSPTRADAPSPARSPVNTSARTPGTPPNQRSPPTPDVTPPHRDRRITARGGPRPAPTDRNPSKSTVAPDSRTESFKTARENPYSSGDEDRSTLRLGPPSGRTTSQSTVRRIPDSDHRQKTLDDGPGLARDSSDNLTPRTKQEFLTFDGEWGSGSEVEKEWDDNLNRDVTVRKRRHPDKRERKPETMDNFTVAPTNATRAVRSMGLYERLPVGANPPRSPRDQIHRVKRPAAPTASVSSVSTEARRSSGMSSRSTASTVVETVLVDNSPQRQKTLRHIRKQPVLRDSNSEISYISPSSSGEASSTRVERTERVVPSRPAAGRLHGRSESQASNGTTHSVADRRARREVWKSGGIPVIVIPDRKASMKSSNGPPSLRSTSSHRSKRSNSVGSVPNHGPPQSKDLTPLFDRPSRRGRAMSESDGSLRGDQRTMDYPPMVPLRTSSLSAPTSRNGSRATSRAGSRTSSLTAESLKAHDALQKKEQEKKQEPCREQSVPQVTVERVPSVEYISEMPEAKNIQPVRSIESHRDSRATDHKPLVDHNGDPFFGKRLTTHNTPFSQASVETGGTHSAADIAEAMAVNIYPHQNTSVLMVDHVSRQPTSESDEANGESSSRHSSEAFAAARGHEITGHDHQQIQDTPPKVAASGPEGGPVTPPQPQMSMDDVDSPLRNPRAPPAPPAPLDPPAIELIPATPSAFSPGIETEEMLLSGLLGDSPRRRPSFVRRALSLRRGHDGDAPPALPARGSGLLAKTLSLSRNLRKDTAENPDLDRNQRARRRQYPTRDTLPPEENKLHPFWHPVVYDEQEDDQEYYDDNDDGDGLHDEADRVYRYPPIDNRPRPPITKVQGRDAPKRRGSLSQRLKNTFAILPVDDDQHYMASDQHGPERRTIRRTPSGQLRVVLRARDSTATNGSRASLDDSSLALNRATESGDHDESFRHEEDRPREYPKKKQRQGQQHQESGGRPSTAPDHPQLGHHRRRNSLSSTIGGAWTSIMGMSTPLLGGGRSLEDEHNTTLETKESTNRNKSNAMPDNSGDAAIDGGREDQPRGRPAHARNAKPVDERGRRLFPSWQDKLMILQPQQGLAGGTEADKPRQRRSSSAGSATGLGLRRRLSSSLGGEHRREKRSEALRQKISGPREVRDGVGDVIKRNSYKGPSYQIPAVASGFSPSSPTSTAASPAFAAPPPQSQQLQPGTGTGTADFYYTRRLAGQGREF